MHDAEGPALRAAATCRKWRPSLPRRYRDVAELLAGVTRRTVSGWGHG